MAYPIPIFIKSIKILGPNSRNPNHAYANINKRDNWVFEFLRNFVPFGDQSEGAIRAVTNTDLGEEDMGPLNNRAKHGIDFGLEFGGPPARQLAGRVEEGVEVEDRVKRGFLEGAEP